MGAGVKITVQTNVAQVAAAMRAYASQVPFATAKALTKTAQDIRNAERDEMRKVFDRPTPYTLNSLYLERATKRELVARVWFKDDGSTRPHYINPQVSGGDRVLKRFEQRLVRAGYMQPGERAVPGAGARLDAYGNVSKGQIVKILSQLKTANVLGDFSDATNSKRSRAKRAKEAYFVSRGRGTAFGGGAWKNGEKSQHLPRGVWVRRSFGALGTAIKPVLLFVGRTSYKPRFKFFEVGEQVYRAKFNGHFTVALAEAGRTAIPKQQGGLFA